MHIVALAGRHILEQRYVEETQITHGLFAIASQHYPLILVEMHLEVWGNDGEEVGQNSISLNQKKCEEKGFNELQWGETLDTS
jgi:hypothetical protein